MPEESVQFKNSEGETLAGSLHLPENPPQVGLLLAHCFTCSRHTTILRQLGQALTREGFAALRFDFSGNGQSEGRFQEMSYSKHRSELLSAARFMDRQGISIRGLAGHSMGAALVLLAAADFPRLKGVCTLAGRLGGLAPTQFLDLNQQQQLATQGRVSFRSRGRQLELSQAFFDDARQQDLPGAITALSCPLLVVHGDRDTIIPLSEAEQAQAFNPQQVTLEIVSGADHMFSRETDRSAIVARVAAWFKDHLGEQPTH